MTSVGYNFNDFSKNQLTKFPAVWTVLRQNIVHNQGLGIKPPSPSGNFACDFRCRISDHELNRKPEVVFKIVCKSQEMVQNACLNLSKFCSILVIGRQAICFEPLSWTNRKCNAQNGRTPIIPSQWSHRTFLLAYSISQVWCPVSILVRHFSGLRASSSGDIVERGLVDESATWLLLSRRTTCRRSWSCCGRPLISVAYWKHFLLQSAYLRTPWNRLMIVLWCALGLPV